MNTQQATQVTVFSHESIEYYTPRIYVDAARAVMGDIDMDPASCDFAQAWINAKTYYTKETDGLSRPWFGRVWLNPPYSTTGGRSNADIWAQKLEAEIEAGRVTCAILLVKAALGYVWFNRLFNLYPVCLVSERIRFLTVDGPMPRAKQTNAFFLLLQPGGSAYIRRYYTRFAEVFGQFGRVILPEKRN